MQNYSIITLGEFAKASTLLSVEVDACVAATMPLFGIVFRGTLNIVYAIILFVSYLYIIRTSLSIQFQCTWKFEFLFLVCQYGVRKVRIEELNIASQI